MKNDRGSLPIKRTHNSDFVLVQVALTEREYKHIETKLIHSGELSPKILGAVIVPIFQSAMFETLGEKNYDNVQVHPAE